MDTPAKIKLSNLYKVYDMGGVDVGALDDVNIQVSRSEFVSVIGSSGSGKSTLLSILSCLDNATSGTYLLEGQDVTDLPDQKVSRIRNQA